MESLKLPKTVPVWIVVRTTSLWGQEHSRVVLSFLMENVFMSLVNSASLCFFVKSTKKTTGFENYLSILISPISQLMIRLNKTFSLVFGEIRALN